MDTCINCALPFSINKKVRLTAKLPETNYIVGEVLMQVMSVENPAAKISPLKPRPVLERRGMCNNCCRKLKNLYVARLNFFPPPGTQSYVRRKMDFRVKDNLSDSSTINAPPTPSSTSVTPVGATLPGTIGVVSTPTATPVTSKLPLPADRIDLRQITPLKKELRRLALSRQFQGSLTETQELPSWERLDAELKRLAPNLRRLLFKLTGTNANCLTPRLAAVVSILANSVNKFSNRFQIYISSILASMGASKQVYGTLNGMGLCTSYKALINIMDKTINMDAVKLNEMGEESPMEIVNDPAATKLTTHRVNKKCKIENVNVKAPVKSKAVKSKNSDKILLLTLK